MLEHLGLEAAARRVDEAVVADLAERTPGATRTTAEVGDAIAARVAG
jgi:3-isopropylmalate dehydrogenase